ncbi:MAG: hypothetical protein AAB484_02485 [Patescibacteria group bacterium]
MYKNNFRKEFKKGSTLIEIVVVTAILALVSLAFLGTFTALSQFHYKDMLIIKGELLAEEGIEALRFVKESGWNNLSSIPSGSKRYLSLAPSAWSITTNPEVVDGEFFRYFRVYEVLRDASDDIVSSSGTIDPDTLLLDVSVDWNWRGSTTTANYKSYITNI